MSAGILLTAILAAIVVLAVVAKRLRTPYPVVFVVGGLVLALVPGVPQIRLAPETVFLLFLPALIFGDAWTTDVRAFWRFRQPIALLATGLVVVTSAAVALVAHALIGLPYPVGFVLGAILSPTDAVATDAIAEAVGMPRRLAAIINGESLVNDATGLVVYRFAVAAVATGAFSLADAGLRFVYVAGAGIAVGLAVAWLILHLLLWLKKSGLSDELIEVAISLVSPFAVYVPADAIGASGVLAAVAGGMFLSANSSRVFTADSRIAASAVWNLLFFTFNGAAFVLIGIQLHGIAGSLGHTPPLTLAGWALAVTATLVVVRFAWVFIVSRLRRRLDPSVRKREGPDPPWTWTFVLGAAGMRGIVSLAAALAIPETTVSGAPFPHRELIVFITFVAILVTLVGGGVFLPWFIRRFEIAEGGEELRRGVALAKVHTADAVRERLRTLEPTFATPQHWEAAGRLATAYERQAEHYAEHLDGSPEGSEASEVHAIEEQLRREVLRAEREALAALRRDGVISDDAYRQVEWEMDLTESRG